MSKIIIQPNEEAVKGERRETLNELPDKKTSPAYRFADYVLSEQNDPSAQAPWGLCMVWTGQSRSGGRGWRLSRRSSPHTAFCR